MSRIRSGRRGCELHLGPGHPAIQATRGWIDEQCSTLLSHRRFLPRIKQRSELQTCGATAVGLLRRHLVHQPAVVSLQCLKMECPCIIDRRGRKFDVGRSAPWQCSGACRPLGEQRPQRGTRAITRPVIKHLDTCCMCSMQKGATFVRVRQPSAKRDGDKARAWVLLVCRANTGEANNHDLRLCWPGRGRNTPLRSDSHRI